LLDPQGYLWRSREEAVSHVTVAAARAEMRAQIEAGLSSGVHFTHIDTHMGSVVHPKFLPDYLQLAAEYGLVAFLPNITRTALAKINRSEMADDYLALLERIDTDQIPTLDHIIIDTLNEMQDKQTFYRQLIDQIDPGLTHLLFHPACLGAELLAIDRERPHSRHADYLAWRDPSLKQYISDAGIHLIGYAELQAHL
jgi:hypothetical protein